MVLLVLGEVSDTFTETFLTVASLFSIWMTISMVIVVVPFFHFYKLFSMIVPVRGYGLENLVGGSGRMMQLNQAAIRRAKSKRRRKVILASVCAHMVSLVFFLEFGALDGDPIYSKGSIFSKVSGGSGSSNSNSNGNGGEGANGTNIFTVSRLIARAGVVGVIVLGVLSGFGAIHYPYTTMSLFARPVSDAEIERDEERLVKALETAVERKKRLVLLERELFPRSANERRQQRTRASMYFNIPLEEDEASDKRNTGSISNNPYENDAVNRNNAKNNNNNDNSRLAANNFLKDVVTSSARETNASQLLASSRDKGAPSLLSKLASSAMQFVFSGRNGGAMTSEQKLQNAKFEVVALDRVVRSLFLELKERRALKKRAVESRTTFGRAKNTSGVLMSVCCAVKLLSVFGQIVLGKAKNVDVVTKTLQLLLLSHSVNVTAEQLSQYLSLAFIAFLVGSSTRNFLYFLSRAFDALGTIASSVSGGSNVSETTTSLVLFCTEIVGLYFLSSVLLVREQLPSQYRDGKTFSLFGGDMRDLSDTFFGMEERDEEDASAQSKPEKTFYQSWYDLIFFVSSFASLLVLFAFHKFNAVNAASAKEEREMFFYSSSAASASGGVSASGGEPLSGIIIAGGGNTGGGVGASSSSVGGSGGKSDSLNVKNT